LTQTYFTFLFEVVGFLQGACAPLEVSEFFFRQASAPAEKNGRKKKGKVVYFNDQNKDSLMYRRAQKN